MSGKVAAVRFWIGPTGAGTNGGFFFSLFFFTPRRARLRAPGNTPGACCLAGEGSQEHANTCPFPAFDLGCTTDRGVPGARLGAVLGQINQLIHVMFSLSWQLGFKSLPLSGANLRAFFVVLQGPAGTVESKWASPPSRGWAGCFLFLLACWAIQIEVESTLPATVRRGGCAYLCIASLASSLAKSNTTNASTIKQTQKRT